MRPACGAGQDTQRTDERESKGKQRMSTEQARATRRGRRWLWFLLAPLAIAVIVIVWTFIWSGGVR